MPPQSSPGEFSPAQSLPHDEIPLQATSKQETLTITLSPDHVVPTHNVTASSNFASIMPPPCLGHSIPPNRSMFDPDEKPTGNPSKKRRLATPLQEPTEFGKALVKEKENENLERKAAMEEKRKTIEDAKRHRDDEKRRKDEQRAEVQRQKDEYKRRKDDEKAKKVQENAKKERAQTRLSSFFGKSTIEGSVASSKAKLLITPSALSHAGLSVQPTTPVPNQSSDYQHFFRPFFIKKDVIIAPPHSFSRDSECKEHLKNKLDQHLAAELSSSRTDSISNLTQNKHAPYPTSPIGIQIADLFHLPHHKRCRRGKVSPHSVKQLLVLINSSETEHNVNAALSVGQRTPGYYLALLNELPTKHLNFWDDVRPPYTGTFTRLPPENSGLRKGRNPFERCLPKVDYDYPSDEEWLVPDGEEDGEELVSEPGDDEEDDLDEEDMDDFLDDEDDQGKRRSGALCPLLPSSSGLSWENSHGRNERNDFQNMRLGILLDGLVRPINPFCTSYWLHAPQPWNDTGNVIPGVTNPTLTRAPPHSVSLLHHDSLKTNAAPSTIRKHIPLEDMEAFKMAVNGSYMTKAGLVELLKKQFPKTSKDAIRETLGLIAMRVGNKEVDKRWVLRD